MRCEGGVCKSARRRRHATRGCEDMSRDAMGVRAQSSEYIICRPDRRGRRAAVARPVWRLQNEERKVEGGMSRERVE